MLPEFEHDKKKKIGSSNMNSLSLSTVCARLFTYTSLAHSANALWSTTSCQGWGIRWPQRICNHMQAWHHFHHKAIRKAWLRKIKQLTQGCCEISGGAGIQISVYLSSKISLLPLLTNCFQIIWYQKSFKMLLMKIKLSCYSSMQKKKEWKHVGSFSELNLFPSRGLDGIA